MFTFDNQPRRITGELPTHGVSLDPIEIGETNEVWYQVYRSKRELRIVEKTTGKTLKTASMDENFKAVAQSYGLHPKQIAAALAVLTLEMPVAPKPV